MTNRVRVRYRRQVGFTYQSKKRKVQRKIKTGKPEIGSQRILGTTTEQQQLPSVIEERTKDVSVISSKVLVNNGPLASFEHDEDPYAFFVLQIPRILNDLPNLITDPKIASAQLQQLISLIIQITFHRRCICLLKIMVKFKILLWKSHLTSRLIFLLI